MVPLLLVAAARVVAWIDHVLTSEGLTVTGLRTGRGAGSDHRPLVADVARTRMARPPPG